MGRKKGLFALALPLALLLVLALACGGEEDVDLQANIDGDKLENMVLSLADFGEDFSSFERAADSGPVSFEEQVQNGMDPEQERKDLQKFEWVSGYQQNFMNPRADAGALSGMISFSSSVDLFKDAKGASGYFKQNMATLKQMVGKTKDGIAFVDLSAFDVKVADESAGVRSKIKAQADEGEDVEFWVTSVAFRHGRLLGTVVMMSADEQSIESQVKDLGRAMDDRIINVLAGVSVEQKAGPTAKATNTSSGKTLSSREVFAASSQRLQEEVKSLRGEMEMRMSASGMTFVMKADYAMQTPDKMHMRASIEDFFDMEMLLLGDTVYVYVPEEGWQSMSLKDMGVDGQQFQDLMENRSLVDYDALLEGMGAQVEDLGEETIDGKKYKHYRANIKLAEMFEALSGALAGDELLPVGELEGVSGAMKMDFWLDASNDLPYKFMIDGEFNMAGESIDFEMTALYLDYNKPVQIPAPPTDAKPFIP